MPWHLIVYDPRQKPDDPWLVEDRVFRAADYPDEEALLAALGRERTALARRYPPPGHVILSGSGPDADSPEFTNFVVWLLRDAL